MRMERMARRQGFRIANVEERITHLSIAESFDEVRLHQMPTAGDIDQGRALGKPSKKIAAQNAAGILGQREEADQYIGAAQKFVQFALPGESGHPLNFRRTSAPAAKIETEWGEADDRRTSKFAHPQKADLTL